MIGLHESHKLGAVGNVGRTPVLDRKNWGGHSGVGRWLTMLAVPLLTCGGIGVAHAGEWKSQIFADYTTVSKGTWNGVHYDPQFAYIALATEGNIEIQTWANRGGKTEAKANGTYSIKFTWMTDEDKNLQTQPPPTNNLTVRVWCSMETDVQSYGNNGVTGVVEADNGLGHPAIFTDYAPPLAYRDALCGGERLFTLPVDPVTGSVTFGPFEFNAKAEATAPTGDIGTGCFLSVYVGAQQAQADSRHVRLSRPGAIGEAYDPDTNVTTGDTTFSYYIQNFDVPPPDPSPFPQDNYTAVPNLQNFQAARLGQWGSNVNSFWNPAGDNDTRDSHSQMMRQGSTHINPDGVLVGGASPPQSVVVTYQAIDSADNVSVMGYYALRLHDEWEVVSHTTRHRNINIRPHPNGEWATATYDGQPLNASVTQQEGWTVGVTFTGPGKMIADFLGVSVAATSTTSSSATSGAGINNVRAGYGVFPQIYDAVITHEGTANQWGPNGFVGNFPFEANEPDTPSGGMMLGDLVWRGEGAPPPGGPFTTPPLP